MASRKHIPQFPPLKHPDERIADSGKVRVGDSIITAEFPPLRLLNPTVADPGRVRLGDSIISGEFPVKR